MVVHFNLQFKNLSLEGILNGLQCVHGCCKKKDGSVKLIIRWNM